MKNALRAALCAALLAAMLTPALPGEARGTCYHEGREGKRCCDTLGTFPVFAGDVMYYLDARAPARAHVTVGSPAINSTVNLTPNLDSGLVWLYEETNGVDDLQRGGHGDRCYDDIYAPRDTVVL